MSAQSNARLVHQYLAWMRDVRRCSSGTVYVYAGVLRNLCTYLGPLPLAEVTTGALEAWLERPRPHGGRAKPATLAREVATLRSLYRYLGGRGLVKADPTALLVPPVVHNVRPKPVSDSDWLRLWSCADIPADGLVALGLGYYCGLRRLEITRLNPVQVDLASKRIAPFVRKGGHEDVFDIALVLEVYERFLPHLLPGGAERFTGALQRLVEGRTAASCLLPWEEELPASRKAARRHVLPEGAIEPMAFNRRLQRWSRAAGLKDGAVTPHRLRHSFVTNLLRAGVSLPIASRLAGHRSIATTMRYAKAGASELRDWLDGQTTEPFTLSEFQRHAQ